MFFPFSCIYRTEPRCITCDLTDVLWSSRFYYVNCTHFDAFVSPSSSIATNYSIDKYILECRGPGLPLAGNYSNIRFFYLFIHFFVRSILTYPEMCNYFYVRILFILKMMMDCVLLLVGKQHPINCYLYICSFLFAFVICRCSFNRFS